MTAPRSVREARRLHPAARHQSTVPTSNAQLAACGRARAVFRGHRARPQVPRSVRIADIRASARCHCASAAAGPHHRDTSLRRLARVDNSSLLGASTRRSQASNSCNARAAMASLTAQRQRRPAAALAEYHTLGSSLLTDTCKARSKLSGIRRLLSLTIG